MKMKRLISIAVILFCVGTYSHAQLNITRDTVTVNNGIILDGTFWDSFGNFVTKSDSTTGYVTPSQLTDSLDAITNIDTAKVIEADGNAAGDLTVNGELSTKGFIANFDNEDYDFTINKNTSGAAMVYDAGNDKFTFGKFSYLSNFYIYSDTIEMMNGFGTRITLSDAEVNLTWRGLSGINISSSQTDISNNLNYIRLNSSGTIINQNSKNIDFTINKNTSGNALIYDAGDDKFTFDSEIKVKKTTFDTSQDTLTATNDTLDFGSYDVFDIVLNASNDSLSFKNATAGTYLLNIKNTGAYTINFNDDQFKISGGSESITSGAGKITIMTCDIREDETGVAYCVISKDFE